MEKLSFYSCKFYVTYRCNSRCVYCDFWSNKQYRDTPEMSLEQARYTLNQLQEIGIRYIDFTGGEPMLYPYLKELLMEAKSLGMMTEYTTNAIAFEPPMEEIIPYVDYFNISLDTLERDQYIRHRGVDTVDRVLTLIERLRAKNKPDKMIAVFTQENIAKLDELIEFAQENRIPVYLSPVFNYFETGVNFSRGPAEEVKKYFYKPFSIVNMHFIQFFQRRLLENTVKCGAGQKILTIAPDGRIVAPCIYNVQVRFSWGGRLADALQTEEFRRIQSQVGKWKTCKECTAFPYLGMSFSYAFNKLFLYQAFSEEYLKFKAQFLDSCFPDIIPNSQELLEECRELEKMIDDLPEPPASRLFYKVEKDGKLFRFKLWKYPFLFEEYLYDSLQEYCWDIENSPHKAVKYFYHEIIPILSQFYRQKRLAKKAYFDILNAIPLFQLDWWKLFMSRYFNLKNPVDDWNYARRISEFFGNLLEQLPVHPQSERIRELIFSAGIMAGLPPLERKDPRYFNEEPLTLKFLLLNRDRYSWKNWQSWFSPEIRKVLESGLVPNEVAVAGNFAPPRAGLLQREDLFFQRLPYDKASFYRWLEVSRTGHCESAEEVILRLKTHLSREETAILKDWLRRYLYFIRPDLLFAKVGVK